MALLTWSALCYPTRVIPAKTEPQSINLTPLFRHESFCLRSTMYSGYNVQVCYNSNKDRS